MHIAHMDDLNDLADALGVPQNARCWTLHVPFNGPATIECELVVDKDLVTTAVKPLIPRRCWLIGMQDDSDDGGRR